MHAAIIGGGIVGVSCALELQRRLKAASASSSSSGNQNPQKQHRVTLIDRLPHIGEACSFGNAGVLASGTVNPICMPGIARKAPSMLRDAKGPLAIRWRYLLSLAPWLAALVRNSDPAKVDAIADALSLLLSDAVQSHKDMAAACPAASALIRDRGIVVVYPTEHAAFTAPDSAAVWDLRRKRGVRFRGVHDAELRALLPALSPAGFGVEMSDTAYVSDPSAYVKLLAQHFVAEGGIIRHGEVCGVDVADDDAGSSLSASDGRRCTIRFAKEEVAAASTARTAATAAECPSRRPVHCDRVVVAAGAWSTRVLAKFTRGAKKAPALHIPLEAERGYHVTVHNPGIRLDRPVMHAAGGFIATPIESPPTTHAATATAAAAIAAAASAPGAPAKTRYEQFIDRSKERTSQAIRFAGTVELSSVDAKPDWRRAGTILEKAIGMFPHMDIGDIGALSGRTPKHSVIFGDASGYTKTRLLSAQILAKKDLDGGFTSALNPLQSEASVSFWMGQRPSLPDCLPIVGCDPRFPESAVVLAFGHQHVGLTSAPATARWVGDLVLGERNARGDDISAFSPTRFS